MIQLVEFCQLEQLWLQQGVPIAYGVALVTLVLTFFTANNYDSDFDRDSGSRGKWSKALLRSLRVGAYWVVFLALVPALLWDLRDGMNLLDKFTLRAVIAAGSTASFCLMQHRGRASVHVEQWVWIDSFCYHIVILDNLLFWDHQPQLLPTLAALTILGVLQTVFPAGLVVLLQQLAVLTVCAGASIADHSTPESGSRFFRAMMLFVYTLSVPHYRRVFDRGAWEETLHRRRMRFRSSLNNNNNNNNRNASKLSSSSYSYSSSSSSSSSSLTATYRDSSHDSRPNCLEQIANFVGVNFVVGVSLWLGYVGVAAAPLTALPCMCVAFCAIIRMALSD